MDEDVAALVVDNGSGMCKVSHNEATGRTTTPNERTRRRRKENLVFYKPLIILPFLFGCIPRGKTLEYSRLSRQPILIASLSDGEKIDEHRSGPTSRTPARHINYSYLCVLGTTT